MNSIYTVKIYSNLDFRGALDRQDTANFKTVLEHGIFQEDIVVTNMVKLFVETVYSQLLDNKPKMAYSRDLPKMAR